MSVLFYIPILDIDRNQLYDKDEYIHICNYIHFFHIGLHITHRCIQTIYRWRHSYLWLHGVVARLRCKSWCNNDCSLACCQRNLVKISLSGETNKAAKAMKYVICHRFLDMSGTINSELVWQILSQENERRMEK